MSDKSSERPRRARRTVDHKRVALWAGGLTTLAVLLVVSTPPGETIRDMFTTSGGTSETVRPRSVPTDTLPITVTASPSASGPGWSVSQTTGTSSGSGAGKVGSRATKAAGGGTKASKAGASPTPSPTSDLTGDIGPVPGIPSGTRTTVASTQPSTEADIHTSNTSCIDTSDGAVLKFRVMNRSGGRYRAFATIGKLTRSLGTSQAQGASDFTWTLAGSTCSEGFSATAGPA